MREINFRAWDPTKKIMFNACFVGIGKVFGMTKTFKPKQQLENVIIMQSAGVQDKNGVEIYEGDILINKHGIKFILKYEFGSLKLQELTNQTIVYQAHFNGENNKQVEVLGNIYQNPEFLKIN